MHDRDSWNTPPEVLDRVRKIAPIRLDPCSNRTSSVNPVDSYCIDAGRDGLKAWSWAKGEFEKDGLVFCNPPYSRGSLYRWAQKMVIERRNSEIVFLVPDNTSTAAWQDYLWNANAVCFPDHRIAFLRDGVPVKNPPMATVVGYFGHRKMAFYEAFRDFGKVVFP